MIFIRTIEEEKELEEFIENMTSSFGNGFTSQDQELVKKVIYNNSWSTYEESGGLAIFEGFDGETYAVEYGHLVMTDLTYNPQSVTEDESIVMMLEMEETIEKYEEEL